jgi:hypothetical protein
MFSLIFSYNSFWLTEHLTYSVVTGAVLFWFVQLKEKVEALRPSLQEQLAEARFFLQFVALSVGLQFLYHFVYDFSIVDFGSRFVFCFFQIFLNKALLAAAKNLSSERKNLIEKGGEIFIVFVIFICFLSILNSQSGNSCGQSILDLFLLTYLVLGVYSCVNAVNCYLQVNGETREMLLAAEGEDIEGLRHTQAQISMLRQLKEFYTHFFVASFASFVLFPLIFWLKLRQVSENGLGCTTLFAGKSFIFKLLLSLVELVTQNAINGFVVYQFYWRNRSVFEPQMGTGIGIRMTQDVFEDQRSVLIRSDKQGMANN